jgi:HEAT repeat protein
MVIGGLAGYSFADDAELEAAVKAAGAWTFGGDASHVNLIAKQVVQAAQNPETKKAIEKHIIAGLAGAKTPASKDFFCRQLVIVGSQAAAGELGKLLGDKESSHMARYALGRLPGKAVDRVLLEALEKVDDDLKVGMIYTLGRRQCQAAVDPAIKLIGGKKEDLAIAALAALSRIDSPRGTAAIAKARKRGSNKFKLAATDAYLTCAKRSSPAQAAKIYAELLHADESVMCRIAALNGLVMSTSGPKATALIITAMSDKDPKIRQVAVAALRNVSDPGATKAIEKELARRDEQTQAMLINVLAGRDDKSALPIVTKAAGSSSPVVRISAITGLGAIGDASTVPMLADLAVNAKEGSDRTAAHNSLVQMPARGVNRAIAALIPRSKPPVRIELVKALALRQASDEMGAVVKAAKDEDPSVQTEAMKSLRVLAEPKHLSLLVGLLTAAKDESVRKEAQTAILAATMKIKDGTSPVAALLAAEKKTSDNTIKISLLRTMGMIGHDDALGAVQASVKSKDAGVKDAAIRAMVSWPTAAPIKTLSATASDKSASKTHRILALRGYISLIDKQLERSDAEIMADYSRAIALASGPNDKRLVLSKLSGFRSRAALKLAESLTADKTVKRDAEAAVRRIKSLLARPGRVTASHNSSNAKNAIDGNLGSRWDTAGAMKGGEWFKLELDADQEITGVILDASGSNEDYPRGYEVYVSRGSIGSGRLVAKGKGDSPVTKIKFDKPVKGAIMKIIQTGRSDGKHWSIHELTILAK